MDLTDPVTFSHAYDQYHRGVYAAALRVTGSPAQAQDVVQDVFLRLWRRPWAFDARRGDLGAYLRLMARSRAIDLHREAQVAGRATDRLVAVAPPTDLARLDDQPEAAAEKAAARGIVRRALTKLPTPQREALVLAYWGGLTADEIARRINVPLGTAKSRIRLGLLKLREECGPAFELAA